MIKLIVNYKFSNYHGTEKGYVEENRSAILTFDSLNQVTNKKIEDTLKVLERRLVTVVNMQKL